MKSKDSNKTICEHLDADIKSYPKLHLRKNTKTSRIILGSHLKHTLHASFIKDMYEDFSEYLATILSGAALAGLDASRFVADTKLDLQVKEILQAGSWESVVRLISDKIFRALENEKNTKSLITKLSNKVGLNLDSNFLDNAMPYLDARHMLVHQDGKADEGYKSLYGNIEIRDGKIALSRDFLKNARTAVTALAEHIDEKVRTAGLIRPQDLVGGKSSNKLENVEAGKSTKNASISSKRNNSRTNNGSLNKKAAGKAPKLIAPSNN